MQFKELFGKESRDVLQIAWPSFVELFLGSLFSMVNMMMLGNMANVTYATDAVAAVGLTSQPLLIGFALVQAMNIGATAIVARYYGAGRHSEMQQVLKHVMVFTLTCFTIPLSLLMMWQAETIMGWLGGESSVIAIGSTYFRVMMISFVLQGFVMTISAALRGIGESKVPMRINVIANFINLIGSYLLIYGVFGLPALAIDGAAVSTIIANVIAVGMMVRYLVSGKSRIGFQWRERFVYNSQLLKQLLRLGVPTALEQVILRLGVVLFMNIIASLGTTVYAAHQIATNVVTLSLNPGQAFSIAAASLVGRSLGEKDLPLAKKYGRIASGMGMIFAIGMGLTFYFGAEQIARLYTQNQDVVNNVIVAMHVIGLVQPLQVNQLVLAGALRGAGDTRFPLVSTVTGIMGVRIALAYYFVVMLGWGLAGAWYAQFIDQAVRWVLIYWRFRSGRWQRIVV